MFLLMARVAWRVVGVLALGFAGNAALAQGVPSELQPKTVLELYTSQGCSSCPAADALLKAYIDRPDVIALSLPVDYWDYLGWKDTLANAKFTQRQRAYAKMRGDGRIYTPQIIVNGIAHANGAHAKDIDHAIAKTAGKLAGDRIAVRISARNGKVIVETGAVAEGDKARDGIIWLALIQKEAKVQVRGGENHGRALTYYNVVRDLKPVGTWAGKPLTVTLERAAVMTPETQSCAVLLQSGQTGPIIGAAYLPN